MTKDIAIAIVAHHSRRDRAEKLAESSVRAECIFIDTPELELGAGKNHLRAWAWLSEQDTIWSVILEDDALPVPQFRAQLDAALAVAPTPVVSLYLGRARPPGAQEAIGKVLGRIDTGELDPCWLVTNKLLHHVGVAIKTNAVDWMTHAVNQTLPIDEAIGEWATYDAATQVSYTWPSLVDHDYTLPTVIDHHVSGEPGDPGTRDHVRDQQRRAWRKGTREHWTPLAMLF